MNEGNVCAHCGKDLVTAEEIHVVEGEHFCSKDCAIAHQKEIIVQSAHDTATEWYNSCAEIVTPVDIGICYERIWTAYSKDDDITIIFLSKCLDKECTEVKSVEAVGFYFGAPDESSTETFMGQLKAEY